MIRVETTVDDEVHRQILELAAQHTRGNVPAMISVMLRQATMEQEYDYAVMCEARLERRMGVGYSHKGERHEIL